MIFALHRNAPTTPAIRAQIATSVDLSARELSRRYGVSEATIYKMEGA